MDVQKTPKERADLLIAQMTIDEKLAMLHGVTDAFLNTGYVGYVPENTRLGIPALKLNDGPQGMRDDAHVGTTTAFPSALTVGATWDVNLVSKFGKAMAQEFFNKGCNIFLGPGLNLARVPLNGRNFEYLSGADPFLGYTLVKSLVAAIQKGGLLANAKHWIQNNQETNRDTVSAHVDERTRYELYYQPFIGAVEADVGSFMCSYNKINELWSCENPVTLQHDLKDVIGFEGFVMSDWGATHSISINAGLDQEMPAHAYFGEPLTKAVQDGSVKMSKVNDSVRRILTPMFKFGIFDTINENKLTNNVKSNENSKIAREIASKAHVLVKNKDDLLPLPNDNKPIKIALIGRNARMPIISGGGSGSIFPSQISTPYAGLLEHYGIPDDSSLYQKCDNVTFFEGYTHFQWGCESAPAVDMNDCALQCATYLMCSHFSFSNNNCMMYPSGKDKRPDKNSVAGICMKSKQSSSWKCNTNEQCVALIDGDDLDATAKLAKEADVAIVSLGTFAREGSDRQSLNFDELLEQSCDLVPPGQDNLVQVVAATGIKTIVAITAPGAVLMTWHNDVNTILHGFFPGEEYGRALTDVLFGKVNPSARLPVTIPNSENEIGFTTLQYPGVQLEGYYTEGLYIDYRWYNLHGIRPAFSFGHGLSYTKFEYIFVSANELAVVVNVKNVGKVIGAEVAQLYLTLPQDAKAPILQLKGFIKTNDLQPGETQKVVFELNSRLLSTWCSVSHSWKLVSGEYKYAIGASVEDIRLNGILFTH